MSACSTQKQTDNEHIKAIKESNLKHSKTTQSTTERYVQKLSDFFLRHSVQTLNVHLTIK